MTLESGITIVLFLLSIIATLVGYTGHQVIELLKRQAVMIDHLDARVSRIEVHIDDAEKRITGR